MIGRTEQMAWSNLRKNQCPKCRHDLVSHESDLRVHCGNNQCDFVISRKRMQEIVQDQNVREFNRMEQPTYTPGEGVEDLQKTACSFCHTMHAPEERCAGFGV